MADVCIFHGIGTPCGYCGGVICGICDLPLAGPFPVEGLKSCSCEKRKLHNWTEMFTEFAIAVNKDANK